MKDQTPLRTAAHGWTWVQPRTREELLMRLADARDLRVPERERENLCGAAHAEITRMANDMVPRSRVAAMEQELADAADKLRVVQASASIEFRRLEALAAVARDGWWEIASAPKDGTLVLLGNANEPGWPLRCRRWQDDHWRGRDSDDATHWQPLPSAPRVSGDGWREKETT